MERKSSEVEKKKNRMEKKWGRRNRRARDLHNMDTKGDPLFSKWHFRVVHS
jgi:hypothetical protein